MPSQGKLRHAIQLLAATCQLSGDARQHPFHLTLFASLDVQSGASYPELLRTKPDSPSASNAKCCSVFGAGDGDRTRNQRLGKPLLYH